MKFSYFFVSAFSLCALFFTTQNLEAGFSHSGRMQSKNLNFSIGGTLDNNGELVGTESANVNCETLAGKGLIQAPQIIIKTKIFAFQGTIDCSGKCTIIAAEPFNDRMFKRKGRGEFMIVIDQNLNQKSVSFDLENHDSSSLEYDINDSLQMIVN